MTAQNRSTLYSYYLTNSKPTQAQFANLIDSSLNLVDSASQSIASTVTFSAGSIVLTGLTSGATTIGAPAIAGSTSFIFPSNTGTNGQFLSTDGLGNSSWVSSAVANPLTLGTNGGTGGSVILNGSTSGSCTIKVDAAAGTATNFKMPTSNGTNLYLLQTDGSGNTSWVAPPSAAAGAITLLSTATPVAASSVIFDSTLITPTYKEYWVVFINVFASTAAEIYLTGSVNNGGAYLASGYAWTGVYSNTSGTSAVNASASDAQLNLTTGNNYGQAAINASYMIVKICNPSASAACPVIWDLFSHISNMQVRGTGYIPGNTAINNLKFAASTGTFTAQAVKLYGVS